MESGCHLTSLIDPKRIAHSAVTFAGHCLVNLILLHVHECLSEPSLVQAIARTATWCVLIQPPVTG